MAIVAEPSFPTEYLLQAYTIVLTQYRDTHLVSLRADTTEMGLPSSPDGFPIAPTAHLTTPLSGK